MNDQTILAFSNDFDKLMATLIIANGGKIIACTMSMDVMGITKDELIDGIEYGGVANIGEAEKSIQNLFKRRLKNGFI